MAAPISEAEIRQVVSQVLNRMQTGSAASWDSTQYGGRKLVGIFEDMNEAIETGCQRNRYGSRGPQTLKTPFGSR